MLTPTIKDKVLFITPHLSTGGLPQYLLKKIQTYKDDIEIYVVEWSFLGSAYVVQRDAIISMLPPAHFFSLSNNKHEIIEIIEQIKPDIIHFEELSESMASVSILEEIYLKKDREYFITENTHSSHSNPLDKIFLPDKFIFASVYTENVYKVLEIPSSVWEYPIESKIRPDRDTALQALGLDPNKKHILNIGLFTPGKNQGEIFEIARKFSDDIQFHFVGNQASNFEHYWLPLMDKKPDNCIIWGERNDVQSFMLCCDLFLFTSRLELNPLVIKEALGCGMIILMYKLPTYLDSYDNIENLHFMTSANKAENEKLLNILLETRKEKRTKIVHLLSELDTDIERISIASVSKLADKFIEYTIHYNPITTELDSSRPPLWDSDLNPGHLGCFDAFRKAIAEDFSDEYDYLVVCERDCILEKTPAHIKELLIKTYTAMENHNVHYFSFGDTEDLETGYLQSTRIYDIEDFAFITDKIIGLQFIIFDKTGRDFLRKIFREEKWQGMDLWLTTVFQKYGLKMGILNTRVTTQQEGYSLIDNTDKKFKLK